MSGRGSGHRNVAKRLSHARKQFSGKRSDEVDADPETAFGAILYAVVRRQNVLSVEGPVYWEQVAAGIPRRMAPYLGWLGKQVRWWLDPGPKGFWQQVVVPREEYVFDQYDPGPGGPGAEEVWPSGWLATALAKRDLVGAADRIADAFPDIVDWAMSQNPPLNRIDLVDAAGRAKRWHDELRAKGRSRISWFDRGNVLFEWDDGWTVQSLRPEQLPDEGDAMGNCVGSYGDEVGAGQTDIYSLRDPLNQPHVDIELTQAGFDQLGPSDRAELLALIHAQWPQHSGVAFDGFDFDDEDYELGTVSVWIYEPNHGTTLLGEVSYWMPSVIAQVRDRSNRVVTKPALCRRAVESMLRINGYALKRVEAWGELLDCARIIGLEEVEAIEADVGQEVPEAVFSTLRHDEITQEQA